MHLSSYLSSQLSGLLLLTGTLAVPGVILYFAAHLSQRVWFTIGCYVVCIFFAAVLCTLLLVKGGSMGIPAIAALEAVVAAVALLLASLLKLHQQITLRSSGATQKRATP
jgi:hypothetical protein